MSATRLLIKCSYLVKIMSTTLSIKTSELACQIFKAWAENNSSTINLTNTALNIYRWCFWNNGQINSITVFVKGSKKGIQNLYFNKSDWNKGLYLQKAGDCTHVCWVDVQTGDSALVPYKNLSACLELNTDADDFNSFRTSKGDVYVVPLDYLEAECIGVRCRNLISG